jgi:DNA polymerase-3 subunit beta
MQSNFIIDQKKLSSILGFMQPICSKRTPLDTTTSIFFHAGHKELVLKSTDLEISLQYSCPFSTNNLQEASFLLAGKRVFELVKEMDGQVSFVVSEQNVGIESGAARLALNVKDWQEFPSFPERIENLTHIDSSLLVRMLDSVAFLIPQNNSNPALNGLFIEVGPSGMKMTATDGHCLAQVTSSACALSQEKSWLLPRRAIVELKKIIENTEDKTIFLGLCGNQLVFSGEYFNFFSKLLADQFPQYASILKRDGFAQARVMKNDFMKALRRSSVLLSGQFIATRFAIKPTSMDISMRNKEVGAFDESIELIDSSIGEVEMRFYAPYLLNGMQVYSGDMVTFWLQGSARPIIFESQADGYMTTYLVMPVSQTNEQ